MDLYFSGVVSGNKLILSAATEQGKFVQEYTLEPDSYTLDYDLKVENLGQEMDANVHDLKLHWVDHLAKLEKVNNLSKIIQLFISKFKIKEKIIADTLWMTIKNLEGKSLEWVSHNKPIL